MRDWLYVDDHVEGVWLVLTRGAPGARYNIGGRNEWRNLDLLEALLETLAAEKKGDLEQYRKLITFVKDRPGHDRRYAMDCSRIERDLGWVPRHDFVAGLRETVRWYLNNLDWVESVRTGAYRSWLERNYAGRG